MRLPVTSTLTCSTASQDSAATAKNTTTSSQWTKQQVEASVHSSTTTRAVKVVAAHQLKSVDIQIVTNTTAETTQLEENQRWLRGLGEHAELIVPTYGVIVHGIPTNYISIEDQEATTQQMLADNHTVIPNARIPYIGWLTKESNLKQASSIVVEFTEPEMANAIIYAGLIWPNSPMRTLRPRLPSKAVLPLLPLRPHWNSMQSVPNLRPLRGATRDKTLQAEGSSGIQPSLRGLQTCSYGMEFVLLYHLSCTTDLDMS